MLVEMFLRYVFKRSKLINSSVVDQNVEPAECLFRFSEKAIDVFLLRDVGLHGDGFSAALRNFVNDFVRAFF
jgi:hypothetical protein